MAHYVTTKYNNKRETELPSAVASTDDIKKKPSETLLAASLKNYDNNGTL